MFGFGKRLDPQEQAKAWKQNLRKEMRQMDRQIREIEREENKIKPEVKKLAKKGELASVKTLAKQLAQSRKAKDRIVMAKTQMNSVMMQIQTQTAMSRVAGAVQKSAVVMKAMGEMLRVPEVSHSTREMAREMEKAGIIDELMQDSFEEMEDDEDEELADSEVDKVVSEITGNMFGQAGAVPTQQPQAAAATGSGAAVEAGPGKVAAQEGAGGEDEGVDELQSRLKALTS